MESGAGVVSARRARAWRSRSSSSIFRCYGTGLHGRRLKAREKGSRPRSGSSWTLAGAAEAASAGTAVETAVLEHSARARARRRMARDSCGAEPCRPGGNGGQSCGEQSRQQQTFGKHSTDENHSWFLSCAILVSLCRLETGRQGRSTALGSLTERRGPLPVTTKARIRQPGSGPGAWVSHRGDTSGGKGLFPDEGSTGQRLASPWFGSSTVILPKPVGRRTPSRLWTVVSCSCRKPPRVRRVVRCHTWGWSRMAIVRLLLRELEGSGTVVVVAVEPLVGGVGLIVGGWESKPSNRSTQ